MNVLCIKNVGLSFGTTEVLRSVSPQIEPGEFVSILGSSGAGKSTLFRLLLQDVKMESGTSHPNWQLIMKRFLTAELFCTALPAHADETIGVALDWTPNTNHVGLYDAQA